MINEYQTYIKKDDFNMNSVPSNIIISTITINCNLGTLLLLDNIGKYMDIEPDNLIAIKIGKTGILRCIDSKLQEKFKSINKNQKKNFYNQLTTIIKIYENKYINIKLFKNGSIQMTGCKDLYDANIALNKLINKLKLIISIKKDIEKKIESNTCEKISLNSYIIPNITKIPNNIIYEESDITSKNMDIFIKSLSNKKTIIYQENSDTQSSDLDCNSSSETYSNEMNIQFVENIDNINVNNIKIDLINSNFAIKYQINKEHLYNILIKQNVLCRISSIHACINIKHKIIDNDKIIYVSIFIFQTGNIIIIGKKPEYIRNAYIYIVKLLNKYKPIIMKKNICELIDENYINIFLKDIKNL